jgi:hypothetical protein
MQVARAHQPRTLRPRVPLAPRRHHNCPVRTDRPSPRLVRTANRTGIRLAGLMRMSAGSNNTRLLLNPHRLLPQVRTAISRIRPLVPQTTMPPTRSILRSLTGSRQMGIRSSLNSNVRCQLVIGLISRLLLPGRILGQMRQCRKRRFRQRIPLLHPRRATVNGPYHPLPNPTRRDNNRGLYCSSTRCSRYLRQSVIVDLGSVES